MNFTAPGLDQAVIARYLVPNIKHRCIVSAANLRVLHVEHASAPFELRWLFKIGMVGNCRCHSAKEESNHIMQIICELGRGYEPFVREMIERIDINSPTFDAGPYGDYELLYTISSDTRAIRMMRKIFPGALADARRMHLARKCIEELFENNLTQRAVEFYRWGFRVANTDAIHTTMAFAAMGHGNVRLLRLLRKMTLGSPRTAACKPEIMAELRAHWTF